MGGTGIGPVLRKTRLLRGKSIEEASRETRIRAEYLQALERERFETLLGEVYVRGFLRSYSTYLGLDPSKVLSIYNRQFGSPVPPERNGHLGPIPGTRPRRPILPRGRARLSWPFLIAVALALLGVFAAVGLLARAEKPPGSGRVPAAQSAAPESPVTVAVGLKAIGQVRVTVWIDGGQPVRFLLREDDVRSFEGGSTIRIRLDRGGRARITVNDHDLGKPGGQKGPYSATFRVDSFRGEETPPSPSAKSGEKKRP